MRASPYGVGGVFKIRSLLKLAKKNATVIRARSGRLVQESKPLLHTTQGHHLDKSTEVPVSSDGRQQLAVEAAESLAEELPIG